MRKGSARSRWWGSYGASLGWRTAHALPLTAAVLGSPGHLATFARETPVCPVLLHFATLDPKTPAELRERTRALPGAVAFDYDAGHAFTCPRRPGFDLLATRAAERRTHEFLTRHLD